MTEHDESPYVNIHKVADYFQVAASTIRKWLYSGHIPANTYIKVGEVYRFRIPEVEAALSVATKKASLTAARKEAQLGTSTKMNGE